MKKKHNIKIKELVKIGNLRQIRNFKEINKISKFKSFTKPITFIKIRNFTHPIIFPAARKPETTGKIQRVFTCIGICAASLWLTGCKDGAIQDPENISNLYMAGSMEEAPVVDYPVPQPLPNVLADRRGYSVGDVKKAFVTGKELPDSFTLVNAKTGEAAYYGTIKDKAYNAGLARYVGYADFSQVDEPGSYYVECELVGQSYRFDIQEQLYLELFNENYAEILKDCESGGLPVAGAMRLLEAYEWYGELFPDQNRNDIPDVLEKLQGWVAHTEENGAGQGQEALYAAFLTKYSYNYKNYDYQYATECLKRAATVWGQVPDAAGKGADRFYALTELFRATGLNTYRNGILEYKGVFENDRKYLEEEGYLYGSMTYLMTRQKVDAALCEELIYTIMSKGEEISEQYRNLIAPAPPGSSAPADLMKYMSNLSCANYILNIYQYTNIIEECLHFLMGRNMESVNYYEGGDRTRYLLWFAQLAAAYEDMMGVD